MQYFRPRIWMLFCMVAWAGTLFSGVLQGAIYDSLNGKSGLPGWRWLFVVDFLITIPLAVYTYACFPDTPLTTQAFYLTADEKELAVARLNRQPEHIHGEVTKSSFKRIFSTWHIYGFCFIWTMGSNCEMFSSNAVMQLYLSSLGTFSVTKVNYMPAGVSAVGIFSTLVLGWYSDFTRRSWHIGILLSATAVTTAAIMLHPPSFAGKMFALYLNGCQYANQTVMFAWANRLVKDDENKRSFIVAAMNTSAVVFYSFWSISFYAANMAPMWRRGAIAMLVSGCLMCLGTLVVKHLEDRDAKLLEMTPGIETPADEGASDGMEVEKVTGSGDVKASA
ncbi:putative pantothenate transporter protein [Phaeoacremonium minimum UCRPA7]|uniref:Putative pantothenate transporter protein n=1 Tax=Phaeoacremonium minimum (strain UCR-PA7) TaxID=1286976 RepID=R8BVX2_PHAM7|nr:putative pantothenate transporter protein [Phaeoacremonium minimum UCRPA7]EOO03497.1 putative pantothenate transporter protein [Phaeoacremonium minimum UCRPA7]